MGQLKFRQPFSLAQGTDTLLATSAPSSIISINDASFNEDSANMARLMSWMLGKFIFLIGDKIEEVVARHRRTTESNRTRRPVDEVDLSSSTGDKLNDNRNNETFAIAQAMVELSQGLQVVEEAGNVTDQTLVHSLFTNPPNKIECSKGVSLDHGAIFNHSQLNRRVRSKHDPPNRLSMYQIPETIFGRQSRYSLCSGYASLEPGMVQLYMEFVWKRRNSAERRRPWISMHTPVELSIMGADLCSQLLDGDQLSIEVGHAIMMLFAEQDEFLFKRAQDALVRHFVSPMWANACLCRDSLPDANSFSEFFGPPDFKYNINACKLFVGPVKFGRNWACFAVEPYSRIVTVIMPKTSRPHSTPARTWVSVAKCLSNGLLRCVPGLLDTVMERIDWTVMEYTLPHRSVHKSFETGLVMTLIAREFDGESVVGKWDKDSISSKIDEVLSGLLSMACNNQRKLLSSDTV